MSRRRNSPLSRPDLDSPFWWIAALLYMAVWAVIGVFWVLYWMARGIFMLVGAGIDALSDGYDARRDRGAAPRVRARRLPTARVTAMPHPPHVPVTEPVHPGPCHQCGQPFDAHIGYGNRMVCPVPSSAEIAAPQVEDAPGNPLTGFEPCFRCGRPVHEHTWGCPAPSASPDATAGPAPE